MQDGEGGTIVPDQLGRRASLMVTSGGIAVPMANGNVMMLPLPEEDLEGPEVGVAPIATSDINITEEVNRSGVWTSLEGNQNNGKTDKK